MSAHETGDIRNVVLVGHGGSGKTTLLEAMLAAAGVIQTPGSVERGNTVSDYEPEERAHHHSQWSAVASLEHRGRHLNLIDTPGYPEFAGRALPALSAVETALVVVDARAGIQMNTRRMMEAAAGRGLARLLVVNRIDAPEVDLPGLLEALQEAFGPECLPINLPAADLGSVIDCFGGNGAGESALGPVDEARTRIVEQVVETDESLMETYLDGGDVEEASLKRALVGALREGHLVPVCFTSAATGVGVEALLDLVADVLPSPLEGPPPPLRRGPPEAPEPVDAAGGPDAPFLAHVFKVSIDPFVGRLAAFRIHQGTVTRDSQLLVGDARKPFKVSHLFRLHGKEHIEIDRGVPGDICAVAKVDDLAYWSVLHESHEHDDVWAEPIELPASMYGLAVQARSRGDEQKISDTLARLAAEDPSFIVEHSAATKETVIRGLGDLHLRMMIERMKERYNVEVETRPPRIPYRETITAPAEGHHRHKKQTGGAGQFGEVFLRVEPLERGAGFEFVDQVVGGVIPSQLIPAVEKGVRQVLESGAVAGYPMQDVRVTVYDGKHHPVDSKEVAFITAGKKAFLDAVSKAGPIVLEPIVKVEITVPQENMGDIAGDLSSKRGRVAGTTALGGGMVVITGQVPLSELESYQSELKSVTGGAGSYTMEFSHYDPVPRPIQERLAGEFSPGADED